jgi:hypothetical protein
MLKNILPDNIVKRKVFAIVATLLLCAPLTIWSIYGIGEYGIALFILIPILLGLCSTLILTYEKEITYKEAKQHAFLTLFIFLFGLILFAIEGLICIAMALPFAFFLTWFGAAIGHSINEIDPRQSIPSIVILTILVPLVGFQESKFKPEVNPVTTKIEIHSSAQTVWKNVIAFPELKDPTEFIFKIGISYPIKARIEGSGAGAMRFCQFNTGDFVEPIIKWEEGKLLAFNVEEQPEPLKELSFWNVNSPHLHDYFVSKKGQFRITDLGNGTVELEGTTWYYQNIKPGFYWNLWSNMIIHMIHSRVLTHIKEVSEMEDE